MKRKFNWDGEKIKEEVREEEKKHSTKDILNGLDHVRNQIHQFENSKKQLEEQMKTNDTNMRSAKEFEKELNDLEEKCLEIQKAKLLSIIADIKEDCYNKAKINAEKIITKAPDAYDERQVKQLPYLEYQKLLATNEKISEKISSRIIKQYLYEEPIFDNPFKD